MNVTNYEENGKVDIYLKKSPYLHINLRIKPSMNEHTDPYVFDLSQYKTSNNCGNTMTNTKSPQRTLKKSENCVTYQVELKT